MQHAKRNKFPLWKFYELYFLSTSILVTFIRFFLEDYIPGFRANQITYEELCDPSTLASLIQREVVAVHNRKENISLGAGGTGTDRFALTAELKDGSSLNIFVKIPSRALFERVFLTIFKVYHNELNFYKNVRKLLPDIADDSTNRWCPEVYCAKWLGCGKFILILEDVSCRSGGCECQYVMDPYSQTRAKASLMQFAKLHAYFWNRAPVGIWSYSPVTGASVGMTPPLLRLVAEESMKNVLKRYSATVLFPPEILTLMDVLLENYSAVRSYWSTGPLTFCHGDSHVGNMFFSKINGQMGFLDMQCVSADSCMRDVAYHLINSCDSEALARLEEEYLQFYLAELDHRLAVYQPGTLSNFSYHDAYFMYRTQAAYCLLAWVICCGASELVLAETATPALLRMIAACQRLKVLDAIQRVVDKRL